MSEFEKHFTVAEARALLPDLRRRLLRIHALLAEERRRQEREGGAQVIIMRGNGKGPILSGEGARKNEAQRLIEEIAAQGIQIKDLERGLVDFPHFRDGDPSHEVFLCWHLGEDTIEYWHEIDAGYAGRRPL
ncbi:MAG: DUF2203 domain-containing protein [Armatimonadetes bacterium]|nr:DUF2203 domain-containing protein [Armatimonadota bacterium]